MQESCYRRMGASQDFRGARVGMKELDVRFQSPTLVLACQRASAFSLLPPHFHGLQEQVGVSGSLWAQMNCV